MTSNIPPEVANALSKANEEIKNSYEKIKTFLLKITSQVNIGELTLADYIFSAEKQKERERLAERTRLEKLERERQEVAKKLEAERLKKEAQRAEAERIKKEQEAKAEAERIKKEQGRCRQVNQ